MTTSDSGPGEAERGTVVLQGVGKRYTLHRQKPFLLHEFARRLARGRSPREEFWALREVSLAIRQGEAVGIVGRNGAGKSTLLGLVAGAIHPTLGTVNVHGRVGALLELGAGFHPELTGRENIYLNASLLGLSKARISALFQNIVEFSELAEFIDVPLRNYSTGMHVRLGFSVAAHIDPDILIIDEALAVGDQNFQQKCIARILEFKRMGKTMLFVSHGLAQVRSLCERVVWFEHGRIKQDGPTDSVLDAYLHFVPPAIT